MPCINPEPVTSRGLSGCAKSGSRGFSAAFVDSVSGGTSMPSPAH